MIGPHPATQAITILQRGKSGQRDGDGNTVRAEPVRVDVQGLYAPAGSSENTDDQQRVTTHAQVLIPDPPEDLAIAATDQIEIASEPDTTFEVAGKVQRWAPGLVIPVQEVSG